MRCREIANISGDQVGLFGHRFHRDCFVKTVRQVRQIARLTAGVRPFHFAAVTAKMYLYKIVDELNEECLRCGVTLLLTLARASDRQRPTMYGCWLFIRLMSVMSLRRRRR